MNGKWFLAIVISALLGAGLFAAGLLVGLSFSPRVELVRPTRALPQGRVQNPDRPRLDRRPAARELLTLAEARQAAQEFLARANLENLEVGRILVFQDGAYVVVENPGSQAGAFELQVDARTKRASVEFGPTMMWNTEFGLSSGHFPVGTPERHLRRLAHRLDRMRQLPRGRDRVLRFFHGPLGEAPTEAEAGVTPEEALAIAGRFLHAHASDFALGHEAHAFPGYFTIDVLQDGVVHGLISVNAETGQVWPHMWRGKVVEASE